MRRTGGGARYHGRSTVTSHAAGVRPTITDTEFRLLRDLIHREAGIQLPDGKMTLLASRLRKRVRALGLPSFGAYYRHVVDHPDAGELLHLLDCISTNETRFFREPQQFTFLDEVVFPAWYAAARLGGRPKRVRVWSAACSTGEEPYSLAMALLHHFPPTDGWHVEVVATDISTRALAQASAGVWPVERAAHIPHGYLKRFMQRGTRSRQGEMRAGAELRSVITFRRLNLHAARYTGVGLCDLIVCRNVLMYFSREARTGAVARMLPHLAPSGYLLVGHAESLGRVSNEIRTVQPTVYRPERRSAPLGALPNAG